MKKYTPKTDHTGKQYLILNVFHTIVEDFDLEIKRLKKSGYTFIATHVENDSYRSLFVK